MKQSKNYKDNTVRSIEWRNRHGETWNSCSLECFIARTQMHFVLQNMGDLFMGQHCVLFVSDSNMTSFFRFVDNRAIYRWHNLIHTCIGECDWLFHWQHKLCATFSANVNINYRFLIKVYYRICTLTHIRIEINHENQNVFWVLTWVGGY